MRISTLITKNGTFINGDPAFIVSAPIVGDAGYTLFNNQITLEFFNDVIEQPNGIFIPNVSTVVTSGISGTLTVTVLPSQYAPYPVTIEGGVMTLNNTCILQWSGITDKIIPTASGITGANYINILFDRN